MRLKQYLQEGIKTLDLMFSDEMLEIDDLYFQSTVHELSQRVALKGQPWGDLPKNSQDMTIAAKQVYQKAADIAKSLEKGFLNKLRLVSAGSRNPTILVGVKGMDAFLDKVVKRGRPASDVTDVLRGAVLTETSEGVLKVVANIRKQLKVAHYEYKEPGADPEFGYHGSHHFKILVEQESRTGRPVPPIFVEVQVMTKHLWAFKEEAHKIYGKWRSVKDADARLKKADQELSKFLFKKGNVDNPFLVARIKGKGKKPKLTRRERKYRQEFHMEY